MEQARISSSQGTQAPHAARSRQGGDAASATATPGSFLALLSAHDDVIAQEDMLGDVTGGAANPTANSGGMELDSTTDSAEVSAVAAWQGLVTPDPAGVPQTTAKGGFTAAGNGSAAGWGGALVGGDGLRQGLVAETALLDGAADVMEAGLRGHVAGYGRILSRMQSALAQRTGNAASGIAGDAVTVRPSHGVASQHTATVPLSLASGFQGGNEHAAAVGTQSPSIFGERSGGLASAAFASESMSVGAGGIAGFPASARGGDAQTGGRPGEGQLGGTSWSEGVADAAPLDTGGVDGASMFADPTQVGAEEYVTDQVAYWVNQKTQNAELTLDRDGQPVQVSVSLSGNEAHVTFRSDQSETRDLLDRSMAQLSDLLRSEGLVLSGMSVGTSAGDGTGANDAEQSRNRDGARQAQVVSSVPAGIATAPKVGGATDHAVDVFV